MEPTLDQFDLLLTDADSGSTIGLRVDWSSVDQAPVTLLQEEVLPEGGELVTEGDELYSTRDLGDYYRIMFRDFKGGAGQVSRDIKDYDPTAFYTSRAIDTSLDGIRLGPGSEMAVRAGLRGDVIEYRGRLACTSDKTSDANNHKQVVFYDPVAGDWTEAPDITSDTEATALATDGQYCYVALAGSGGIWRGYDPHDYSPHSSCPSWASYSSSQNITHLCYCSGFLYGVQNDSAGYFNDASPSTFQTISLQGALVPDRDTFGLVSVGNWVYWGVRKGARGWVYALQHNPANTDNPNPFEQYVELPSGFVPTCMDGYLGMLFIGGYKMSKRSDGLAQGAIYLATENGIALLCTVGEDPMRYGSDGPRDNKVQGVQVYGEDLWIVTDGDLYRWDVKRGGLFHVREVFGYLDAEQLADYRPNWDGWLGTTWSAWDLDDWNVVNKTAWEPDHLDNTWEQVPEGDYGQLKDQDELGGNVMVCARHRSDEKIMPPYAIPYDNTWWPLPQSSITYRAWSDDALKYNDGKLVNAHRQTVLYRYPQSSFPSNNKLSNTYGTTMELETWRFMGRCLEFGIIDNVKETVVRIKGAYTEDEQWWQLQVGEWDTKTSSYEWWQSGRQNGRRDPHRLRLTLKGDAMEIYVDGSLMKRTTKLRPATGGAYGPYLWWSAGWSRHAAETTADNYDKKWLLDLYRVTFTVGGIYPPAVIPGGYSTSSFAVLAGSPYLAVDTTFSDVATQGLASLDWAKYTDNGGELVTSWSSGRMPGVKKYFGFLDVIHSRLRKSTSEDADAVDESISVQLEFDEGPQDSSGGSVIPYVLTPENTAGGTLTQIPFTTTAARVRARIHLNSDGETTPVVLAVVIRYSAEPKSYQQYLLDLRQNVKTLTGEDFDWATTNQILMNIVSEGRTVTLTDLSGTRRVKPTTLQFVQAMPSRAHDRFVPQGKAILRLRTVT